jgi:molybdopterin synthase catalytic subunit
VRLAAPCGGVAGLPFLIDWLKTKSRFWKLEDTGAGGQWGDARDSDDEAAARWRRD